MQREISDILRTEVDDPRAQLASVARVELTSDLSRADLFVSLLGPVDDATEKVLQHAAPFIRHHLSKRLRDMKRLPELVFHLDHGAEHSQHIADLLDDI